MTLTIDTNEPGILFSGGGSKGTVVASCRALPSHRRERSVGKQLLERSAEKLQAELSTAGKEETALRKDLEASQNSI